MTAGLANGWGDRRRPWLSRAFSVPALRPVRNVWDASDGGRSLDVLLPASRGPRWRAFRSRRRPSEYRTWTPGVWPASPGPAPPGCSCLYLLPRAAPCVGLCPCCRLLPSSRVRAGGSLMRLRGRDGGRRPHRRQGPRRFPWGLSVGCGWPRCQRPLGPPGWGRGGVRSGVRVRSRCPRCPRPAPLLPLPAHLQTPPPET